MKQHIVIFRKGMIEDETVAALVFFVLVEDEVSSIDIAKSFRSILEECVKENFYSVEAYFMELFKTRSHEFSDYELFEINGFGYNPNKNFPISKLIRIGVGYDFFEKDDKGEWSTEVDCWDNLPISIDETILNYAEV